MRLQSHQCRASTPRAALLITMALSSAIRISIAQSGYDPPAPIAPTSMQECNEFEQKLEASAKDFHERARACHDRIHRECASLPTGGQVSSCFDRHRSNTYAENTPCGYILYNYPECKALVYQAQCVSKKSIELPKICRAAVEVYRANLRIAQQTRAQQQHPADQPPPSGRVVSPHSIPQADLHFPPDRRSDGESSSLFTDRRTEEEHTNDVIPFSPSGNDSEPSGLLSTGQGVAVEYLKKAAEGWKAVTDSKGLVEPLLSGLNALKTADSASSGEQITTSPVLDKLSTYADKERDFLSALGRRSGQDWVNASGLNYFDPSTTSSAQTYIDTWARRLDMQQQLITGLNPTLQAIKVALENHVVDATRVAADGGSTLPEMDPLTLESVINSLNNCSYQIKQIKDNLNSARMVIKKQ